MEVQTIVSQKGMKKKDGWEEEVTIGRKGQGKEEGNATEFLELCLIC